MADRALVLFGERRRRRQAALDTGGRGGGWVVGPWTTRQNGPVGRIMGDVESRLGSEAIDGIPAGVLKQSQKEPALITTR